MKIQYTKKGLTKFIEDGKFIHNNKYSYDKTIYNGAHIKCIITCPIHGDFEQTPNSHTTKRYGCKKCGRDKTSQIQSIGIDEFIKRSVDKHKNKFDYSLVNFISVNKKVKIICDKGHIFHQTPYEHIKGSGCKYCLGYGKKTIDIISDFIKIHNNKYDYSEVNFVNTKSKIIIICDIHGSFLQTPQEHIKGHGCKKCNTLGKVSEPKLFNRIKEHFKSDIILSNNSPTWLGRQSLDIYFKDYNIAIEYQGIQHFKSTPFFGGYDTYIKNKNRDEKKYKLCIENNCKLYYFTYNNNHIPDKYFDNIFTNEEDLIESIVEYKKSLI